MSSPTARLSAALADRYRIIRPLGAGGMATVYLAEDLKHDRQVAVKVLKPELAAVLGAERFVVEIKTTASMSHPHILPLFDSGTADGFLFYVMPYVEGETLRSKLDRETQFSVDEAVRITREVADALAYAHSRGVIHRDIKPENILLQGGSALVADFGIALAVSAAAGGRMTETGLSLGTPHYMSPEQATAEKEITGRSDVYSLASVCYEMLTGQPPHLGGSAQQIIMKIITEQALPVTQHRRTVPPHVAAAVATALEKLPADRFESAQAFSEALANPGFAVPGTVAANFAASAPRRRAGALALVAAAAAGLAIGGVTAAMMGGSDAAGPVVRFTLELPTGQQLRRQVNTDAPFAISPDGRRIAYVASDSTNERFKLWIRELDRLEPTELVAASRPASPFFSPDGQWVGYFEEDMPGLYKIPVTGGPSLRLANDAGTEVATGAWSEDGWIYYNSRGGNISRVLSTGGEPVQLLPENAPGWRGGPIALPGGRFVAYVTCSLSSSCNVGRLEVLDVETREVRTLIESAYRAWYLGDGILAFSTSDGSIYAVPFDAKTATLKGAPSPLLSGVQDAGPGSTRLVISASGAMAYQPTLGTAGQVTLVELDRSGRPTGRIELEGSLRTPRYAPSLDRVALSRISLVSSSVWVYDIMSRTMTPIAQGTVGTRPAWSPDGRELAFLASGGASPGIYTIPADGSSAPTPLLDAETGGSPSYSPDGQWILYDGPMGPMQNAEDIFAASTARPRISEPVVASRATEEAGVVSPDGRWVAYTADEGGATQVFVRPFRRDGGRWLLSPGEASGPRWTANGELVYHDLRSNALIAARLAFDPDPRVLNRVTLFDMRNYMPSSRSTQEYDVSPDGQRFLMLRGADLSLWSPPIVVLNWRDEVKRLLAGQRQ